METDLNKLRDRAYKTACEHGFHDEEKSTEHWLMLVITEISEAVEADRKNKHADFESFKKHELDSDAFYPHFFNEYVKESVEDELADIVIRLLDFAGIYKLNMDSDIPELIEEQKNIEDNKPFVYICFHLCRTLTSPMFSSRTICKIVIESLFSYCFRKYIDLFQHIEWKMRYNELRPFKNGKEY